MNYKPIYLVASGTGGHIFAALAVAESLEIKGFSSVVITDKNGLRFMDKDRKMYIFYRNVFSGLGIFKRLTGLFFTGVNFVWCLGLFIMRRPISVIAFGGYLSIPTILAARILGIKTIIHEGNAVLGRANRVLSKLVNYVCVSFPLDDIRPSLASKVANKTIVTGMPVRKQFYGKKSKANEDKKLTIMVMGGSQGAKIFSQIIIDVVESLSSSELKSIKFNQQVLKEDLLKLKNRFTALGVEHNLVTFFKNPENEMAENNLIICRAGAATIAEIISLEMPALFIPFKAAIDDHQKVNANTLAKQGCAYVIEQNEEAAKNIAHYIKKFIKEPNLLKSIRLSMKKSNNFKAAENIADLAVGEIT